MEGSSIFRTYSTGHTGRIKSNPRGWLGGFGFGLTRLLPPEVSGSILLTSNYWGHLVLMRKRVKRL